jgi:hypothetical protein
VDLALYLVREGLLVVREALVALVVVQEIIQHVEQGTPQTQVPLKETTVVFLQTLVIMVEEWLAAVELVQ